ncbi:MAG: hypothetical protein JAY74_25385 [Candidatus Thiodiazotropha taylori]|nr:hypothetical protein [Candidatus Thiodiazotropha taylori]
MELKIIFSIIVLWAFIFDASADRNNGQIFFVSHNSTTSLNTIWNVQGHMHIKIINSTDNCGDLWWAGAKNKDLGRKCREFSIPYNSGALDRRTLRLGGLSSDSIILVQDQFEGISDIFKSSYVTGYHQAKALYDKCGSTISCWRDNI